mmetsp:Transcript_39103/g.112896  ORF Transcript_39103/g.112896 Transcript_39103/m.112896 type:complete len:204 (+) Transcript_39103:332-943(+)
MGTPPARRPLSRCPRFWVVSATPLPRTLLPLAALTATRRVRLRLLRLSGVFGLPARRLLPGRASRILVAPRRCCLYRGIAFPNAVTLRPIVRLCPLLLRARLPSGRSRTTSVSCLLSPWNRALSVFNGEEFERLYQCSRRMTAVMEWASREEGEQLRKELSETFKSCMLGVSVLSPRGRTVHTSRFAVARAPVRARGWDRGEQ